MPFQLTAAERKALAVIAVVIILGLIGLAVI